MDKHYWLISFILVLIGLIYIHNGLNDYAFARQLGLPAWFIPFRLFIGSFLFMIGEAIVLIKIIMNE